MLEQLLKHKYKVQVCGNIGIPVFDLDDSNMFKDEILIIECSSYMLASTIKFKPKIMIITNIYPNHLDHHLTKEHYFISKTKCLKNMVDGTIFLPRELEEDLKDYLVNKIYLDNLEEFKIVNNALYYHDNLLMNNYHQTLMGKHNLYNLWFCLKVCKLLNVTLKENILNGFSIPTFRLNKIYEDDNLTIYNDSKSTNVYSLCSALDTVNDPGSLIYWIGGGKDRNDDWSGYLDVLKNIDYAFLFGESSKRISLLLETINVPYKVYSTLDELIDELIILDKKTIILFSPGYPSTDQFSSYITRGEVFNRLINEKIRNYKNA